MRKSNLFSKALCIVISLLLFLPALPFNMASAATAGEIAWPSAGAINLTKEASQAGEGRWKITLTVEGKDLSTPSDVVLVIDKSGSMGGTKMVNTKNAAKAFVNSLLPIANNTKIAIVSFSDGAEVVSEFEGFSSKETLLKAIDDVKVERSGNSYTGGTYMQAGIRKAQELLESSTAAKKSIVLLGDGEPTYSSKVTDVTGVTAVVGSGGKVTWDFSDIELTFGSTRVGSGSSYNISSNSDKFNVKIKINNKEYSTYYPENNGIPTMYQAELAKAAGIRIYSIALGAGNNGENVLKNSASDLSDYYEVTDNTSVLEKAFKDIAGSISYGASNATVVDPMGPMFDLMISNPPTCAIEGAEGADTADIVISQGEILSVGNSHPYAITWYIGKVSEGNPAKMSYYVKIKSNAPANIQHETNGTTTISYTDATGKDKDKNFIVPEVSIGKTGSIKVAAYLVNASGEPVNEYGAVVSRPDLAFKIAEEDYKYNGDKILQFGTYTVYNSELSLDAKYEFYGDDNSRTVTIDDAKQNHTLYFAYQDTTQVVVEPGDFTVKGYEGVYDGAFHHVIVNSGGDSLQFKYGDGDWSGEIPTFKNVGEYTVLVRIERLGDEGEVKEGTVVITQKEVKVKADNKTKTAGAADPALTAAVTGLIDGEVKYTLSRISGETAGTYTITPAGAVSQGNYTVKYETGMLTINSASTNPGIPGGGGGTPVATIPDALIPLADLEKIDHFAYVLGYPDGEVKPMGKITREEVAAIFYRLLTDESREELLSDTNPFTDLAGHDWSKRAISTLYNADIISGYPDGTFRPSAPITRAEFATIAAKFDDLALNNPTMFTDITGHWAEKFITSSENKGWIKGYPDMTFRPEQVITRAEAMTLINNVLGRAVSADNIHPDAIFWPDMNSSDWYFEAVMEATNSHDYIYEEDGAELWTGMKANKVWP